MTRPVGVGQDVVRRVNLSHVLRLLHADGPRSRAELTSRTGLNRSTVAALVADLAARRLVAEGEARATGTPGRPSPMVSVRTDRHVVLALDIGVDSLGAATVALGGHRLRSLRVERPRRRTAVDTTIEDLGALADDLLGSLRRSQRLFGIGVAVAGLVRSDDGLVHVAPNLGWHDVPLADLLRRRMRRRVPIQVANDADAGALAERIHGAGRGMEDLVYISGEVGVGGGVIVAGRPLRGAGGYAAEIGHLTVDVDGLACVCGAVGCWETRVGEAALLRLAGEPEDGGRDAVDRVLAAAERGDPAALGALEELGRWMAIGVGALTNVFDPQRVVLGGLHARLYPYVRAEVERYTHERTLVGARSGVQVRAAAFEDSALAGAAELALEPLLADPTRAAPPRVTPPRARPRGVAGGGPRPDPTDHDTRSAAT